MTSRSRLIVAFLLGALAGSVAATWSIRHLAGVVFHLLHVVHTTLAEPELTSSKDDHVCRLLPIAGLIFYSGEEGQMCTGWWRFNMQTFYMKEHLDATFAEITNFFEQRMIKAGWQRLESDPKKCIFAMG